MQGSQPRAASPIRLINGERACRALCHIAISPAGRIWRSAYLADSGGTMISGRVNIVKVAIGIIAGLEHGRVDRAADLIGVSSPTLYRWMRAGDLRGARGADLLRVHDLSRIPLELLLGADGVAAGAGRTVGRTNTGKSSGQGQRSV